jgi:hypothetical protein
VAPIIAELRAAGVTSLNDIATALNARGIRTPRGCRYWHASQVAQLLKRLAGWSSSRFFVCDAPECEIAHIRNNRGGDNTRQGRAVQGMQLSEDERREAMNRAFRQACARLELTGRNAMPVAELVAIRILELARDGEFDADKMTETLLAEFES